MAYTRPLYLTNPTMKGDDVKEVQIRLNYLGYYQSGIDGEFGLGCDKAVRQFQTNNGLSSDGSCGPATYNTLFSNSAIPRTLSLTNPTMKGDDVVRVQQKLKSLGYYTSSVDGEFGLGSKSAAIQFQTVNGLDPDGYFGPASHKKLMTNPKPNNSSGFTRALYLTIPTMKGDDVKKMQQRLKDLKFYTDNVDGEFGYNSDKAVRSFQGRNDLEIDGSCGPLTWAKLFSSSATSSGFTRALYLTNPTMKGDDVKKVQQRLKDLKYYTDNVDGEFGLNSDKAVRAFQSRNSLSADGSCGPLTWDRLFSSYAIANSSNGNGSSTNVRKVFIDPGHGGTDPGALGNGLKEKDINLNIAKLLGEKLKAKGIEVKYSRTTDTYISYSERTNSANAWGADLFLSIHANSSAATSARGCECYTTVTTTQSNRNLSSSIASEIASRLNIPCRGNRDGNWYVIRESIMPAILIETAFISNSSDAALLKNRANDFAEAIASKINNSQITPPTKAEMLAYSSKHGLFKGMGIELSMFNYEFVPPKIVNLDPLITMKCEVDLSPELVGSYSSSINIGLGAEELATEFITKLGNAGIDLKIPKGNITKSFAKLTAANEINNNLKYKYEINPDASITITLEASLPFRRTPADNVITIYQRTIVTVYTKKKNGSTLISAPIESIDSSYDINQKYTIVEAIIFVAVLVGAIVLSPNKVDPKTILFVIRKFLSAASSN